MTSYVETLILDLFNLILFLLQVCFMCKESPDNLVVCASDGMTSYVETLILDLFNLILFSVAGLFHV